MADYFSAHPDHALLVGMIGIIILSIVFGNPDGEGRRRRHRREDHERRTWDSWRN
ncbi:hypothetical protein JQK15_22350 [Sphingobium sp. BHU LFT2]|uniref:hypothetical protein n=1 Tax=Sphingobium sp. BHU LFT2 TaxID=2807634 RepID=UPI001BEA8CCC|nr:hypothetical protein [Sphingobium sp. BHU LFT2]MBT2246250.1 hypothetical protein [Sphingobium sp. BHU LFT2]